MARILVAEDNTGFRTILELVLGADHHEVDAVHDGREVLEYLKEQTPELILLDVQMPFLDGLSVCRRLKHISRLKHIPIVILTGSQAWDTRKNAEEAGADYLLPKPLVGKDFRHFIHQVLQGKVEELAARLN